MFREHRNSIILVGIHILAVKHIWRIYIVVVIRKTGLVLNGGFIYKTIIIIWTFFSQIMAPIAPLIFASSIAAINKKKSNFIAWGYNFDPHCTLCSSISVTETNSESPIFGRVTTYSVTDTKFELTLYMCMNKIVSFTLKMYYSY